MLGATEPTSVDQKWTPEQIGWPVFSFGKNPVNLPNPL